MNQAAQFAKELEKINPATFPDVIEERCKKALYFENIGDALLLMHSDGSSIIIEMQAGGMITSEVISAQNTLKVLYHYRPFSEVFSTNSKN